MKRNEKNVKQIMYDDFSEHSGVKIATATEWFNQEGLDINIFRKNLTDININVSYDDVGLFRKIFSDFDF